MKVNESSENYLETILILSKKLPVVRSVDISNELGYKTIMWTEGRDTIDWRDKDSEVIYSRAIKNCKGGDFVLMHPTEATKNALDRIIKTLKQQGFELCTVSENLQ